MTGQSDWRSTLAVYVTCSPCGSDVADAARRWAERIDETARTAATDPGGRLRLEGTRRSSSLPADPQPSIRSCRRPRLRALAAQPGKQRGRASVTLPGVHPRAIGVVSVLAVVTQHRDAEGAAADLIGLTRAAIEDVTFLLGLGLVVGLVNLSREA